jgi:hypothetical protein
MVRSGHIILDDIDVELRPPTLLKRGEEKVRRERK